MAKNPKMISVRAGKMRDGTSLTVVLPLDLAPAPGRKHRHLKGDAVVEVPAEHRFTLRSLRNGDLVAVAPAVVASEKPTSAGNGTKPATTDKG